MAPFNTLFSILILVIPLAVAIPRYTTKTISFQVTSLEESSTDAHCGYSVWPHSCWRYCGDTGEWCWIQPTVYCEKDSDCDSKAPCSSSCGKGKKAPEFHVEALDAPHDRPVATQVTFEEPVTIVVEPETVTVSAGPGHVSSESVTADDHSTSPEASFYDAHCGYSVWPHSCWRYCGETGQWCWIQPTVYCEKDSDCDSTAPCSSSCGKGKKAPDFGAENPRILVKLLI